MLIYHSVRKVECVGDQCGKSVISLSICVNQNPDCFAFTCCKRYFAESRLEISLTRPGFLTRKVRSIVSFLISKGIRRRRILRFVMGDSLRSLFFSLKICSNQESTMILISDDIPRLKSIRIEARAHHQAQSQTQPFLSTIIEDFSEQMDLN